MGFLNDRWTERFFQCARVADFLVKTGLLIAVLSKLNTIQLVVIIFSKLYSSAEEKIAISFRDTTPGTTQSP